MADGMALPRVMTNELLRPSVLSSFHAAANQVVELTDNVDPVLSFFSYQPLRATAKPGDIPMFLSTKLMPRGDDDIIEKREDTENADGSRSHVEAVERFNESVDDISASYQAAADDAIAKLVSSSGSSR
eukprot:jgi/Undpi1/130/HiC_scaffold_1.g00130.m1